MKLTTRREDGVEISGVRLPIRFSRSELAPACASPLLGRDTEFVIRRQQ
jgi:crotonobetainyl-CoA:carnitine CoA-transferase CaiB-like acyl-CoA transferase